MDYVLGTSARGEARPWRYLPRRAASPGRDRPRRAPDGLPSGPRGAPGLRSLVSDEQLALINPRGVSTIPIGTDDTGHEIIVRVGRYGPYVQREDDETASLPPDIAPDELTVPLALELIARQYNVTVEQLQDWNELSSPQIRAGLRLLVKPRT